ncbi:tellurite resistance TerB family protein [Chthonobacter albigriseus]|uniref:tellurite resistance TerB family protein n=1 Tax=Chthonobacter albigriseus TaxID=1683161 RepID=UPI0015EE6AAF|nr:tellurite resistance TerB family protein [Chthonobacter albigriseus]
MTKLSKHEALIWVMVVTSAADHTMTEREMEQLGHLVSLMPVFNDFEGDVGRIAETAAARLAEPDGLDRILDLVAESLPQRLHETAYALAVEVAAADLLVKQEELVFLQMLEDRFELPKLAVAAIEHSARVRYRKGV